MWMSFRTSVIGEAMWFSHSCVVKHLMCRSAVFVSATTVHGWPRRLNDWTKTLILSFILSLCKVSKWLRFTPTFELAPLWKIIFEGADFSFMSILISIKLTEDWPWIARWNFTGCLALRKRRRSCFLEERRTVVLSQISINRPSMQSGINGALQNLFIFLLVNKAVLIVVGIMQRVKTVLLERSVTHFVKHFKRSSFIVQIDVLHHH